MPSPKGYLRNKNSKPRIIDRAWAALRMAAASRSYISAAELVDVHLISATQLKRLLRAAKSRGWLEVSEIKRKHEPPGRGAALIPLYRLSPTAPAEAPMIRLNGKDFEALEMSEVSGSDLTAVMRTNGWSQDIAAKVIGVKDIKTVARYENSPKLPKHIGKIIERMAASPAKKSRGL